MDGELLLEQHVAVHGLCCDSCHIRVLKLQESVVLGLGGLLVARKPDFCHTAKLREETWTPSQ